MILQPEHLLRVYISGPYDVTTLWAFEFVSERLNICAHIQILWNSHRQLQNLLLVKTFAFYMNLQPQYLLWVHIQGLYQVQTLWALEFVSEHLNICARIQNLWNSCRQLQNVLFVEIFIFLYDSAASTSAVGSYKRSTSGSDPLGP